MQKDIEEIIQHAQASAPENQSYWESRLAEIAQSLPECPERKAVLEALVTLKARPRPQSGPPSFPGSTAKPGW